MKKLAVVIGRFQPVHKIHIESLLSRAGEYDKVLVLLGSAFKSLDQKNPFLPSERKLMIESSLDDYGIQHEHFFFEPLKDYVYSNNRWVLQVQKIVDKYCISKTSGEYEYEPILVGVDKDDTTFYLKLFPQWKSDVTAPTIDCSATTIRDNIFNQNPLEVKKLVSESVFNYIFGKSFGDETSWIMSESGQRIFKEYDFEKRTKTVLAFKSEDGTLKEAKYKPIAHCVDNIVTWRGLVLLIRRKSLPGKGLWALPGGHVEVSEWLVDAATRELQEETSIYFYNKDDEKRKLKISPDWCKKSRDFDYPARSRNGRKITKAYHWVIPDEYEVHVEAADDADRAKWFSFYDVLEKMDYDLFEDHQAIIAHMILDY